MISMLLSSEARRWSSRSCGRTSENGIILWHEQYLATWLYNVLVCHKGSASNHYGSFLCHLWGNFCLYKLFYVLAFLRSNFYANIFDSLLRNLEVCVDITQILCWARICNSIFAKSEFKIFADSEFIFLYYCLHVMY